MKIFIENIIRQQNIKFNKLEMMNDPYEYKKINSIIKNTYICSFIIDSEKETKNPFKNKGYGHSRMWSQYGDNHQGVCIEFSKSSLVENLKKFIESNKTFTSKIYNISAKPMMYSDIIEIDEPDMNQINKMDEKHFDWLKKNEDEYIFQKNDDYKDENEFRIAFTPDQITDSNSILFPCHNSIKNIYLGDKANMVYLPLIEKYARINNFQIGKILWHNGNPIAKNINGK